MLLNAIDNLFRGTRERLTHTFASGKGLAVRRMSPAEAAMEQALAQQAKAAVKPTVDGYAAMAERIEAETAMNVAGIRYVGAEVEALADGVVAIADLSDKIATASPRALEALSRFNQNASVFSEEFEAMMAGDKPRAIEPAPQQKYLYSPR